MTTNPSNEDLGGLAGSVTPTALNNQVDNPSPESDPVWLLQRHPYRYNETKIEIWFKEDAMKLSSVKMAQLLADVITSQVKVTTAASPDRKPKKGVA